MEAGEICTFATPVESVRTDDEASVPTAVSVVKRTSWFGATAPSFVTVALAKNTLPELIALLDRVVPLESVRTSAMETTAAAVVELVVVVVEVEPVPLLVVPAAPPPPPQAASSATNTEARNSFR